MGQGAWQSHEMVNSPPTHATTMRSHVPRGCRVGGRCRGESIEK